MKLYVILGESGSGKSTLCKTIVKSGFQLIIPYTTRPMRTGEIDGVDYHFITKDKFLEMIDCNKFAEWSSFKVSTDDDWYYGTLLDDYSKFDEAVVILNPTAFTKFKKLGIPHTSFYLKVPEEIRRERLIKRGDDIIEINRRMEAEKVDFDNIEDIIDVVLEMGE